MSTETKSENSASPIDNKALFGPLGKYAIVGVIMGSVIVTTAIMLDRHSETPKEHIAAIEKEIAELNTTESTVSQETTAAAEAETRQILNSIEVAINDVNPVKVEETAKTEEIAAAEETEAPVTEKLATRVTPDTVATARAPGSDALQATKQKPAVAQTVVARPEPVVNNESPETVRPHLAVEYRHPDKHDQQWQARLQARDLEYKKYMAEYFNEIKSRDSERLDQYKKHQDSHIEFLRDQIARQEQLIDELIMKNKESYEMREARIQRRQISREQMLNRI